MKEETSNIINIKIETLQRIPTRQLFSHMVSGGWSKGNLWRSSGQQCKILHVPSGYIQYSFSYLGTRVRQTESVAKMINHGIHHWLLKAKNTERS